MFDAGEIGVGHEHRAIELEASNCLWYPMEGLADNTNMSDIAMVQDVSKPTIRTPFAASVLSGIIDWYGGAFPSQISEWENTITRHKEGARVCFPMDCRYLEFVYRPCVWFAGPAQHLCLGVTDAHVSIA